jgi:hypothetical protein
MHELHLVPIAFFAMIAAIVIVPRWLRERERARMYDTLRTAYEKGQPVPPEMIQAMSAGKALGGEPLVIEPATQRDLRRGIVWLMIGLGFVLSGAALYAGLYYEGGAVETFGAMTAIGAVPLCVGLGYLGLWYFGRNRKVQP